MSTRGSSSSTQIRGSPFPYRIFSEMIAFSVLGCRLIGKWMVKAAPFPISLSTWILPERSLTMECTTERPSPVPLPTSLVVKNGSKIRDLNSGGMPRPVSLIIRRTKSDLAARFCPKYRGHFYFQDAQVAAHSLSSFSLRVSTCSKIQPSCCRPPASTDRTLNQSPRRFNKRTGA